MNQLGVVLWKGHVHQKFPSCLSLSSVVVEEAELLQQQAFVPLLPLPILPDHAQPSLCPLQPDSK